MALSKVPAIASQERRTATATPTERREMCIGERLRAKVSLKLVKGPAGAHYASLGPSVRGSSSACRRFRGAGEQSLLFE